MLRALTVENYRGFIKRTVFELRPLTILLGRNSSGKSSLTRLVPLFQQSLARFSASPVLWSSDSVDMGNICDVISHGSDDKELRIGFRVSARHLQQSLRRFNYGPFSPSSTLVDDEVEYVVRLMADGPRTKFVGIEIEVAGQKLRLDWNGEGVVTHIDVDGRDYKLASGQLRVETSTLFPEITRQRERDDVVRYRRAGLATDELAAALEAVVHARTSKERVAVTAEQTTLIPRRSAKADVQQLSNVVKKKVNDTNSSKISDLTFIHNVARMLMFLRSELSPIFLSAAYIGPSRASGNRFDRIQELAVSRLDSSGTNAAMYIHSLNEREKETFNELLVRACGHIVKVEDSGVGHVSVKIGRVGQSNFENITDVGFGYSQLVPVIAQLHAVRERPVGLSEAICEDVIFAVEQPELHLHPAMQSSLADLFVSAVKSDADLIDSTTIIVETHSETFVAQLGLLVAEGAISPEDIAIYFVDKDHTNETSVLNRVSYTADGVIDQWPVGFFSAA